MVHKKHMGRLGLRPPGGFYSKIQTIRPCQGASGQRVLNMICGRGPPGASNCVLRNQPSTVGRMGFPAGDRASGYNLVGILSLIKVPRPAFRPAQRRGQNPHWSSGTPSPFLPLRFVNSRYWLLAVKGGPGGRRW